MKNRKKCNIGSKLPLMVFLLFAVFCSIGIRKLGQYYNLISKVEAPRCETALKMESMLIAMGCETKNYLIDQQQISIENINEYKNQFRNHQKAYYALIDGKDDPSADTIDKVYSSLNKAIEELVNLHDLQIEIAVSLNNNYDETERLLNEAFRLHSNPDDKGDYAILDVVMQMRNVLDTIRRNLDAYLRVNNQKYEIKIYENQNKLRDLVGRHNNLHIAQGHREWFKGFDAARDKSMHLVQEIIALEKKKNLRLEQFGKLSQELRFVLADNQIEAHEHLDSTKYAGDKFLAMFVLLNPVFAVIGLVIILLSQIYASILVEYPDTETKDKGFQSNIGVLDTNIQIPPPKESEPLSDSVNRND